MTKPTPLIYGHGYHIFNRGNNGENLFLEPRNYQHFLNLYTKHVHSIVETYAYCLLKNHFHLLVRIKSLEEIDETRRLGKDPKGFGKPFGSPSQQFGNLFNAYTKAINKTYHRTGSPFEHPFHRVEVRNDGHLLRLVTYIHRNPQRHGFVDDFQDWPHTSYRAMISQQPTRLERDAVLAWFDGVDAFMEAHQYEDEGDLTPSLVLE